MISDFHSMKGSKYKKLKQAIEFINKNGYPEFIKHASKWKSAYDELD